MKQIFIISYFLITIVFPNMKKIMVEITFNDLSQLHQLVEMGIDLDHHQTGELGIDFSTSDKKLPYIFTSSTDTSRDGFYDYCYRMGLEC